MGALFISIPAIKASHWKATQTQKLHWHQWEASTDCKLLRPLLNQQLSFLSHYHNSMWVMLTWHAVIMTQHLSIKPRSSCCSDQSLQSRQVRQDHLETPENPDGNCVSGHEFKLYGTFGTTKQLNVLRWFSLLILLPPTINCTLVDYTGLFWLHSKVRLLHSYTHDIQWI